MTNPVKVLPFLSMLAAFGMAAPAFAQPPELWEKVGDWQIFVERTPDGAFDVCTTMRVYDNGEAVIFFFNREATAVGFFLENWQLDARETYDVAIQVDNGERLEATALASEDRKSIMLDLELSGRIIEMSRGQTLYLHTAAGSLRFDIAGMEPAVYGLALCALENSGAEADSPDE